MRAAGMIRLLDDVAEMCADVELPADPYAPDADALIAAARRAGSEVLDLAMRVADAQHDHDPATCTYCSGLTAKHPPSDPKPAPPPKPPADPKGK